jgi:hypothetical protein
MILRMKNSKQSSRKIEKWPLSRFARKPQFKLPLIKESDGDDEHGQSSLNNQAQLLNAPVKTMSFKDIVTLGLVRFEPRSDGREVGGEIRCRVR